MLPLPPGAALFPYTTLFRSGPALEPATRARVLAVTAQALAGAEPVPGWSFVAGAHVDGDDARFDAGAHRAALADVAEAGGDRKSTRLNSSHLGNSYAVFCLK